MNESSILNKCENKIYQMMLVSFVKICMRSMI